MIVRPMYNKVRALKRELDKANEKLAAKDKELKKARAECERFQHNIESVNVAGGRDKSGRVGLLVAIPQKNPASLMRDSGVSPSRYFQEADGISGVIIAGTICQKGRQERTASNNSGQHRKLHCGNCKRGEG